MQVQRILSLFFCGINTDMLHREAIMSQPTIKKIVSDVTLCLIKNSTGTLDIEMKKISMLKMMSTYLFTRRKSFSGTIIINDYLKKVVEAVSIGLICMKRGRSMTFPHHRRISQDSIYIPGTSIVLSTYTLQVPVYEGAENSRVMSLYWKNYVNTDEYFQNASTMLKEVKKQLKKYEAKVVSNVSVMNHLGHEVENLKF